MYATKSQPLGQILTMLRSTEDISFPIRDGSHAPCSGSMESQALDHQGSP